jgi:SAM-dependent methyltransferase
MSSYIGRHAELYDIFYADKSYAEEAAFIHQCLQEFSVGKITRLLEIACGTGTHALSLEKFGYDIVATDYSEDMLSCARRKATEVDSSVDFYSQDMRELDVTGEPFGAIVCLFDSLGFVETNESIMKVLRGVHRHLQPDGLFIFEFWHAAAMLRDYDPLRIRRWSLPDRELVRISEIELDPALQLARVTYTIYELHDDGTYDQLREIQTNRYFLVQEMASFLSASDFIPIKWFSGYQNDETINEETWHIIAVARRGRM